VAVLALLENREADDLHSDVIESCGKTNAKSLKVRISTDAKSNWEIPTPSQQAKVLRENADTIDLEIMFA
jgi:hypothetical protein